MVFFFWWGEEGGDGNGRWLQEMEFMLLTLLWVTTNKIQFFIILIHYHHTHKYWASIFIKYKLKFHSPLCSNWVP